MVRRILLALVCLLGASVVEAEPRFITLASTTSTVTGCTGGWCGACGGRTGSTARSPSRTDGGTSMRAVAQR